MKVRVRRSGGFMAARPVEVEIDTTALAPEARLRMQELIRRVERADPAPEARPDAFTYAVRVEEGETSRTTTVTEASADPELRELLHWAMGGEEIHPP